MSTHLFGLTNRTYKYSHAVGRAEFAGTGFRNATDMAIAPDGTVYVCNRSYENRPDGVHVTAITLDEEYITEFGAYGEADGEFMWPTSVALDSKGNLYLADEWLNRISKFTKDGEFVSKWGTAGSGDGELNGPAGLAIDADDNMIVVDSGNNRIQKFALDGKYISQFGSKGSDDGQFNLPWGIALDGEGHIYIADWRNDRIQKFTADGQHEASIGSTGSGVGQLNRPNGVAVDADGDIYVADWMNNRVEVFAPTGRYITEFRGEAELSKWGRDKLASNPDMIRQRSLAYANNPGYEKNLCHPCSVKIDPQGRIAIIDHTRNRIQVYVKEAVPALV
ncbi:MAG: SMP-30/gluconolactonase/LRE family protein [SAR202 cluster bacterium]|nr:SMP-30/gluconolactonase/LRE family protein [SAR202 cluster bacterium]